ncbi:BlaI/MecI/CopY family transcriptional regulator [Blautia sp. XA-2221]|uniref:BlaI/MecI/CopY family transcriptional regulator n=1 Tax=Blautia sp. XA-2221 TaxID=2903961 RepID=UPI0023793CAC|nr:BlaI/MecI/CopY family transcriptional regulator [Blautia sp. XA-2221]
MPAKYDLSNQELFIMKILWGISSEMTLGEITEYLQDHGFQPTIGTAKTYLTRLVKKGALKTRKEGHKLLYSPVSDETGYEQQWTERLLNDHFGGSLNSFLSALTGNGKLKNSQIQQLKDFFDE